LVYALAPEANGDTTGIAVLVVEDDAPLRRLVRRQLSSFGYRVLQAADAATALEILASEQIDVLFTDVVMPGAIDGFALARAATARWPTIRVVLTSGYPGTALPRGTDPIGDLPFLAKPYRTEELKRVIGGPTASSATATDPRTAAPR
jgi:CheY-like chemotaxis protein